MALILATESVASSIGGGSTSNGSLLATYTRAGALGCTMCLRNISSYSSSQIVAKADLRHITTTYCSCNGTNCSCWGYAAGSSCSCNAGSYCSCQGNCGCYGYAAATSCSCYGNDSCGQCACYVNQPSLPDCPSKSYGNNCSCYGGHCNCTCRDGYTGGGKSCTCNNSNCTCNNVCSGRNSCSGYSAGSCGSHCSCKSSVCSCNGHCDKDCNNNS